MRQYARITTLCLLGMASAQAVSCSTGNDRGGNAPGQTDIGGGGGTGVCQFSDNPAADTDGDGFSDTTEYNTNPGSDPCNSLDTPLAPIDTDRDGCSDFDERTFPRFCDNDPNTPAGPVAPVPPDATGGRTFNVTVAAHVEQPFSEADADYFLQQASYLLQSVDDCNDVGINVSFVRSAPLARIASAPVIVTTEAQLQTLFAEPYDYKVVNNMYGVCNSPGQVLGCAAQGGNVVLIANAVVGTWAHEWGHVMGLLHRNDCQNNIMFASGHESLRAINGLEANAYLTAPRFIDVRHIRVPQQEETGDFFDRGPDEPLRDWLIRVVSDTYLAGVPQDALHQVDASMVDILLDLLTEASLKRFRHNIVQMLGAAGNADAAEALMDLTLDARDPVSDTELTTIAESSFALGRLLPADDGDNIFNWLTQGIDPDMWTQRGVGWSYLSMDAETRNELLARFSVLALSFSGSERALSHLHSLLEGGEGQRRNTGLAQLDDQIQEAIDRLEGSGLFSPAAVRPYQP